MTVTSRAVEFALVIGIPLALFLMWRGGEGAVPALAAIGTAFFAGFAVPRVPGSPTACLMLGRHPAAHESTSAWLAGNPCAGHMGAVMWLNLGAPLLAGFAAAEVRGMRRRGARHG